MDWARLKPLAGYDGTAGLACFSTFPLGTVLRLPPDHVQRHSNEARETNLG
jgi:hypothetical protein